MRFVKRVDEPGENEVFVWDTSSLSHAFEDFGHAVISAYASGSRRPRSWDQLLAKIERRFRSEFISRSLLLRCTRQNCFVPTGIYGEITKNPRFHESLLALTDPIELERLYRQRAKEPWKYIGFHRVFKPRLLIVSPSQRVEEWKRKALELAKMLRLKVSEKDAEALALAKDMNATLVTGDRNLAMLAQQMGVKTIYTLGKQR